MHHSSALAAPALQSKLWAVCRGSAGQRSVPGLSTPRAARALAQFPVHVTAPALRLKLWVACRGSSGTSQPPGSKHPKAGQRVCPVVSARGCTSAVPKATHPDGPSWC